MRTILAAIDTSPSARPVVQAALLTGEVTGATVEAIHVGGAADPGPSTVAASAGVPLRVIEGPIAPALLDALASPDVIVAVIGSRGAGNARPVGSTALDVLGRANKPVVVVPPDASLRPYRRMLVPLEGTHQSTKPVVEGLAPLLVRDLELIVLHVFTSETVPRMLDRPHRDLALLGREFLSRHLPHATGITLRSGPIATRVLEECEAQAADLVALSWSQDSSPGRARVIRQVLDGSPVPVLLLPQAAPPSAGSDQVAPGPGRLS